MFLGVLISRVLCVIFSCTGAALFCTAWCALQSLNSCCLSCCAVGPWRKPTHMGLNVGKHRHSKRDENVKLSSGFVPCVGSALILEWGPCWAVAEARRRARFKYASHSKTSVPAPLEGQEDCVLYEALLELWSKLAILFPEQRRNVQNLKMHFVCFFEGSLCLSVICRASTALQSFQEVWTTSYVLLRQIKHLDERFMCRSVQHMHRSVACVVINWQLRICNCGPVQIHLGKVCEQKTTLSRNTRSPSLLWSLRMTNDWTKY